MVVPVLAAGGAADLSSLSSRCDSSSPYIHPVGWCEVQGRPLTAPQGMYRNQNLDLDLNQLHVENSF